MDKRNIGTLKQADPVISIITVVFNDKSNLKNTIESVISQGSKNYEYIIIDGGSTDGTIDIIKDNQKYIKYWMSESDDGIYDAMNKGIYAATGDYVMFLNAGDSLAEQNTLKSLIDSIIENSWPDVMYGSANILSKSSQLIKELKPLHFTKLNLTLFGTRTVCHQSILVKKSISPFYSTDYLLKGELAWYYDILNIKPLPRILRLNFPISNYLLGGVSDISFINNNWERLQVVARKRGIISCIIVIPFLIIPIVFKVKRTLADLN